jgi:hypothetical protein
MPQKILKTIISKPLASVIVSTGPKDRRDLIAYLDETGVLNRVSDKIFGLGLVMSPDINNLHRALINYRNRVRYYHEFKFKDVGTHNILYYINLINEFFNAPNSMFTCFVYDKASLVITNYERAYNSFCGKLVADLIQSLGGGYTDYLTILADDMSTSKANHFEREIKAKVKQKTRRSAVTSVVRLESHAVTEIQLCDVLLGTVAYAFKIEQGIVKPDKAKLQLVKYLQKRLRIPILAITMDKKVKNGVRFKVTEIKNR